jgi:hypothetical protein
LRRRREAQSARQLNLGFRFGKTTQRYRHEVDVRFGSVVDAPRRYSMGWLLQRVEAGN